MGLLQRLPAREIAFVAALIGAAALVGWGAGRTAVLTEVLRPGWEFSRSVVTSVRGGATYFQDLDRLRRENAALQSRVSRDEAELARRLELESENQRLSQLLSLDQTVMPKGIAAHVIGRSPNNWQQRLIIDRGTTVGIGVNSVVLTPGGVIGKVTKASAHAAIVSLLTDPGEKVSVIDQRSRSPGIALGQGDSSVTLVYLPQQVDFHIGDPVITSGYGGVYPKGLSFGKVVRVDQQPNAITPKVTIVLSADLDRLEDVLVLPPLAETPRL